MIDIKNQINKYEDKYSFKEVSKAMFNEYIFIINKEYKLVERDGSVYYKILPNGKLVGKVNYPKKKFYLTV